MAVSRRGLVLGGVALLSAPLLARRIEAAQHLFPNDVVEDDPVRRNISGPMLHRWEDHFETLRGGAILSDTSARTLQFWSEDGSVFRLYPTSVPVSDDLTRLGYTEVVDKQENPTWRPTPAMRERNPEWPEVVPGGDPMNPLGVRALYLSWEYYRTHDTRKVGRRSSDGCIGLYNENILELYELAQVGTQVRLI